MLKPASGPQPLTTPAVVGSAAVRLVGCEDPAHIMMGGGPPWSIQVARRVSRGGGRSHACAVGFPVEVGVRGRHGLLGAPGGRGTEDGSLPCFWAVGHPLGS